MVTGNYRDEFKRDPVEQIAIRGYPVREVSRRLVGWSVQPRMTTDLALQVLLAAVWRRKPKVKGMIHSDQELQFISREWQVFLGQHNLDASMNRRASGKPWAPHEPVSPALRTPVSDLDAACVQQVLDDAKRQLEPDIEHHCSSCDHRARLEIPQGGALNHAGTPANRLATFLDKFP